MKVKFFKLSTAHLKINQIVSFMSFFTIMSFFKAPVCFSLNFAITLQYHDILFP